MNAAAAEFDEEEHVEPLQPDRLDGEEIDREYASPVRSQELAPGHSTAPADRPEPPSRSQVRTVVAETATARPFNSPTMRR
jgi:hypothetical protein